MNRPRFHCASLYHVASVIVPPAHLELPSSITLHQLDLEHEEAPMTTAALEPPLPQPVSAAHVPGFRAMRWPSVFKVAAAVFLLRLLPDVPLQLLASSAVPRAAPSSSVFLRCFSSAASLANLSIQPLGLLLLLW